jgi:hypothetical protein
MIVIQNLRLNSSPFQGKKYTKHSIFFFKHANFKKYGIQ